jgi:hypothetical protein
MREKKGAKSSRSLSGKLLSVEPEYRFAVYKKLVAKRQRKASSKGSPILPGSFESSKRR